MPSARPVVGPFRADQIVALGADGEVWRASGPTGRVAIKIARGDKGPERLAREADILERHAHPHLTRLERKGRGFMVVEYVEGKSIEQWCLGRPLADVVGVCLELVGAVMHLHQVGLVHGDLKPGNVMVDGWNHVKLLDAGNGSPHGDRRGTPGFTAPEVLQGGPTTPASDLYGLGAVLYACFAGRAPFDTADPAAVLHLPVSSIPVPLSAWRIDVPLRLERLISALLNRAPARRPELAAVARVLGAAWKDRVPRPVLGMVRARMRLMTEVARASDGAGVVVVVHGPAGSGRRTLLHEAVKAARLEGMAFHAKLDTDRFKDAMASGARPVAYARASSKDARRLARAVLSSPNGALLLLYSPRPSASLTKAVQITPDSLDADAAKRLGRWLGVANAGEVAKARTATRGHPRTLWIALEHLATRHLDERAPFSLPPASHRVLEALEQHNGVLPLDRLARLADVSLTVLPDATAPLEASGRITVDPSGWIVRLVDLDEP
jgi:serine/threonine-protein kinase